MVAACVAIFCAYVPLTAVSVALPSIQTDLGVSTGELTWVLDAFVRAMAAFIMLSGTLGERHGYKKVLTGGLSLIVCGSVLGLCSGTSVALLWTAQAVAVLRRDGPSPFPQVSGHIPSQGTPSSDWSAETHSRR
ncbi:MFS transporter [Streptomyces sp. LN325]|uniref:MFS transporter n=1 Tax=Streptomyces sp. LN325 TaxID=3112976 RepID=UPI003721C024